jgi:hypothetical protein
VWVIALNKTWMPSPFSSTIVAARKFRWWCGDHKKSLCPGWVGRRGKMHSRWNGGYSFVPLQCWTLLCRLGSKSRTTRPHQLV